MELYFIGWCLWMALTQYKEKPHTPAIPHISQLPNSCGRCGKAFSRKASQIVNRDHNEQMEGRQKEKGNHIENLSQGHFTGSAY